MIALSLLTAACQNDEAIDSYDTLMGNGEKTPLSMSASLSGDIMVSPQTRAANESFVYGTDKVIIGLQNVKTEGGSPLQAASPPDVYNFKQLERIVQTNGILSTLNEGTIYWDDFSDKDHDLKEGNNRGLQALFGVCLNGRTEVTVSDDGTFNWTVFEDQNRSTYFQNSDLLLAPTQNPVAYVRPTKNATTNKYEDGATLTIPFPACSQ